MRPRRIQISRGTLTLLLMLMGASFLSPVRLEAQCGPGYTVATEVHSTTAAGDGSNPTNISLPQFANPGGNTFIGAQVDVFLTSTITITFTNTSPTATQSFFPLMSRPDELDLYGTDVFDASGNQNLPHTVLAPSTSKTYTNITPYNNNNIVDYTITTSDPNLVSYEGGGNLSFTYIPTIFFNNVPNPPVSPSTPVVNDNLTFQVTYSYCQLTVLASNIITFTATRENGQSVALNWITSNEEPGRRYAIEVSTDGKNFQDQGSVSSDSVKSDASYSYSYVIPAGATGKLYFRLRQSQTGVADSYSTVRIIDLGMGASVFSLYPNPPSDYINLNFPSTHDWKVDIVAADGGLVQRVYYPNTSLARVNFNRRLSAGTYFARATDADESKVYVASFTIR
jgi:hypothetical protein